MADYPTSTEGYGKAKGKDGLSGSVVDSSIEGRASEKSTIRSNGAGKKGAGHVGGSNVNHG